jgi:hypothetical protein
MIFIVLLAPAVFPLLSFILTSTVSVVGLAGVV